MKRKLSKSNNSTHAADATFRTSVNITALVISLAVVVVGTPAAYFWHQFQVGRTAGSLLARADALIDAGEHRDAAKYLFQYLLLKPNADDAVEVRVKIAETADLAAKSIGDKRNVASHLILALGAAEGGDEVSIEDQQRLRMRLAEIQLELGPYEQGRFTAAAMATENLIRHAPQHADAAWRIRALAMIGQIRLGMPPRFVKPAPDVEEPIDDPSDSLATIIEYALDVNPRDVGLIQGLAYIYREAPKWLGEDLQSTITTEARLSRADTLMEQLLASPTTESLIALYQYQQTYKSSRLPTGDEIVQQLIQTSPDDLESLLVVGSHAFETGRAIQAAKIAAGEIAAPTLDSDDQEIVVDAEAQKQLEVARTHLEKYLSTVEKPTQTAAAYAQLGETHVLLGNREQALVIWRQGLEEGHGASDVLHLMIAQQLAQQGKFADAIEQIAILKDKLGAEVTLTALQSIEIVEAELAYKMEDYEKAISLAKSLIPQLKEPGTTILSLTQLLASCYLNTREFDLAATTYEDAYRLDRNVSLRLAAAYAWSRAGNTSNAQALYQQAYSDTKRMDVWLPLQRTQIETILNLPVAQRNWAKFEREVANYQPDPDLPKELDWRVSLLKADYFRVRAGEAANDESRKEEWNQLAVAELEKAEQKYPKAAPLLQEAVRVYESIGESEKADAALARVLQLEPSNPEVYLLQSRVGLARQDFEAAAAALEDGLQALPPHEHQPLKLEQVRISLANGDKAKAKGILVGLLSTKKPKDDFVVGQLAALALREATQIANAGSEVDSGDLESSLAELEKWQEELRALQGVNSTLADYYLGRMLLLKFGATQADQEQTELLRQATALQRSIAQKRPNWSFGFELRGRIEEARGNSNDAIEAFQRAIANGTQIYAFERLVVLLNAANRIDDADQVLDQLRARIPDSDALTSLTVSIALSRNDVEDVESTVQQRFAANPNDPLAHVWRAEALAAQHKPEEALESYRAAVDLAPENDLWVRRYFDFLLRSGRDDWAKRAVKEVDRYPLLSAAERNYIYARAYRVLADLGLAEKHFLKAVDALSGDPGKGNRMKLELAQFYLADESKHIQAEKLLKELADAGDLAAAQTLVMHLMGGTPEDWETATKIADRFGDNEVNAIQFRRIRAIGLARQETDSVTAHIANLDQAREMVRLLIAEQINPPPSDRLLLAWLCRARARLLDEPIPRAQMREEARRAYVPLLATDQPEPSHLLSYATYLIELNKFDEVKPLLTRISDALNQKASHLVNLTEARVFISLCLQMDTPEPAERWVELLETRTPGEAGTVVLRARWLRATGANEDDIDELIEGYAERLLASAKSSGKIPEAQETVARVCGATERHVMAEQWWRKLVAASPERYDQLAMCLVRQGRIDDAIAECTKTALAKSVPPPTVALTLSSVLMESQPTPQQLKTVESFIAKSGEVEKDPTLLGAMGNIRALEGRHDEAIELFKKVLVFDKKNVMALNNLATLVGEKRGEMDVALRYINQAIEVAGARPPLMDTKGMVYFHGKQPLAAIESLSLAVDTPDPDSRFYFHLALAFELAGQIEPARAAFQSAQKAGLDEDSAILTKKERDLLAKLKESLKP